MPQGNQAGSTGTITVGSGATRVPGRVGPCGFGNCSGRNGYRRGNYAGYGGYAGYWPGYYGGYVADDGFWSLQEDAPQQMPPPSQTPSVILVQAPQQQQPSAAVQSPKLIEVPSATDTHNKSAPYAAPAPPAIFVLTNGERLQATEYTLTYESLQLRQGRQVRVIPLTALNLDATVAANREQGLDLQVPENRQQMTLAF